jgi:hypothetical protein
MATITSAASGSVNSTATWVGGVVPGPADDVVIAGHSVTFNVDVDFNSLTLNNTGSRMAVPASVTRVINLATDFKTTAAISATAITVSTGQLTITAPGGFRTTTALSQPIFTVSGTGILNLSAGGPDTDLITPTTSVSMRLLSLTGAGARANTTGRLSCGGGTHQIITLAGGIWTHVHSGTSEFLSNTSTAKLIVSSGSTSGTVTFTGDISVSTPATTTGVISFANTATTNTINGDITSTNTTNGGAILHCTGGTTILNGKISHPAGTNSLTVWVAGSCNFRWANRTVTIDESESVTIYCQAGYVDLGNLTVYNNSRMLVMFVGSGSGGAVGATIYNAAGAVTGINFIDVTIVYIPSPAPVLPPPSNVAAGIEYGYSASPQFGTGLIVDPTVLSTAVGTALESISAVALRRFVTVNTGETGSAAGSVASLSGGSFPAVIDANVVSISGDGQAADNLEAMLDGTGDVQLTLGRLYINGSQAFAGTVPLEVKSEGAPPIGFWDGEFASGAYDGLYYDCDGQSLVINSGNGSILANLAGKVLGNGLAPIVGTGVRAELVDGGITAAKIAANAIGNSQIADNAISAAKLAASSVSATQLADNAITANKLASNVLTSAKIASNAITSTQLADNAITANKLASAAITSAKIAAGAIGNSQLADGAISDTKVSAGTLTASKFSGVFPTDFSTLAIGSGAVAATVADTVTANVVQISSSVPAASNLAFAFLGSPTLDVNVSSWLGFGVSGIPLTTANVGAQIRGAVGLDVADLGDQLQSIQTDTGTVIPGLIASLETGGATPEEVWNYFVGVGGDTAVAKIASSVNEPGPATQAIYITVEDQEGLPVKFARVAIVGSADTALTSQFGEAVLYADPGSYEIRCELPSGFDPVASLPVTVNDTDLSITFVAQRTAPLIPSDAGLCNLLLRIVDQSGTPVSGASVTHRLVDGFVVLDDQWLVNAAPPNVTDADGVIQILTARLQVYDFSVTVPGSSRVTIRRQSPDAPQATLSMMVEVPIQ